MPERFPCLILKVLRSARRLNGKDISITYPDHCNHCGSAEHCELGRISRTPGKLPIEGHSHTIRWGNGQISAAPHDLQPS